MRLSHIEYRIDQQHSLMDFISNAVDNLMKVGTSNISSHRVKARLSALKEHWEKFTLNHEAIGIAMTELSSRDKRKLRERSYIRDNHFRSTQESYLEAVEKMESFLAEPTMTRTESNQSLSLSSNQPSLYYQTRLPRLDLPKFNGSPSDWLSFKDMFSSMVLSHPTITSVEKLQYLKISLIGSASHFLKNTALTADNFQKAWDALIAFYENKRLLVNSALSSLTSLKPITKESAFELEKLYTTITQIYRTLETLQRPVHTWDDFLVFIAVQRLDSESVKAWESHLGSAKEPPTWTQFSEFLMTRMLSLQAFEKSRSGKSTPQNSIKSHFAGQSLERLPRTSSNSCVICSANHYITSCQEYTNKSIQQRLDLINQKKLCFNCLGQHRVSSCRSTKRCNKCGKKHHTTIHQATFSSTTYPTKSVTPGDHTSTDPDKHVHHSAFNQQSSSCVLLGTALVIIVSDSGEQTQARVLIDQGSETSLISERLAQLLHLPRRWSSSQFIGIGEQKAGKARGLVSFYLKPYFESNFKFAMSAYILPKLTSTIPSVKIKDVSWSHLKNLQLADPEFNSPGPIDIILGADFYGQIIENGLIKGVANAPIAQFTKFGWLISGPTGATSLLPQSHTYHVTIDRELHDLLQRFWQLEELPSSSRTSLSAEEQECEKHFESSHSRDNEGRYVVKLPLKQSANQLGDSRAHACQMLSRLSKRLTSDPTYCQAYSNFMTEYETLQHMKQVPNDELEPSRVYYLPHHGVIRDTSITTKLRVVFNGSSRTSTGVSLNDILHTGAKLQIDLIDVLIWFRQFRYVFSSDIEKMYRQIKVHPDDWDLQRILWINTSQDILTYQLTTVTYGLACAPFLALRTLLQLITDEGAKFPLAVQILKKGRYVDDIFGGADSVQQAQEKVHQVNQLCMAGGFPLQKWRSNNPLVLQSIPPEKRINLSSLPIKEDTVIHTLGLSWKPTSDTFHFTVKTPSTKTITKRTLLSTIAQLFDPLGLLSPVIIKGKIFIQELWSIKLDWDDHLPTQLADKWTVFVTQLQELASLSFPRWLGIKKDFPIEIHGFCDASQQAIAAAVYLRSINETDTTNCVLVCSKTKVAPLKRLTIPRLELSGAVLLTKLVAHVVNVLNFDKVPVYLWTDSSIVYTWINNHPSRWKDFVHNRVYLIQETLPQAKWRFVPGTDNPADCATRGLTPNQLSQHFIWWTGPQWLSLNSSTWPTAPKLPSVKDNLEERSIQILTVSKNGPTESWDLLHRYSNITKLLRITAICQRVSFASARHQEINILSQGQSLPSSNSLIRLTPFVDSSGFLRVGGRLQSALLPLNAKHPLILPKDSILTKLIISDAHIRTLHGGTQSTLGFIRNDYWILGGRAPVRSFILKCVRCARYRQKRAQQLMGQLPSTRTAPSRPFLHAGIDYAGPLMLKTWKGRAARTYKAYIALFVCHSTSAVHLELVTDYTAEAFLAAYKRFSSRRGICVTLSSDCGTNLKGADFELQNLFCSASNEWKHLASLLANDGTQWKFNPPGAPHFGGKWEAGVKSVKHHLRRVIGEQTLTYEEMATLLTQIEAVLNSRPLCPLTDDPDDLTALTPGHFLIGNALAIIPEPSLEEIKTSRLSRWQQIRQMLDSFWSRWSRECLQRYHAIYKWNRPAAPIKEGSLVLVVDERYPPAKWPLGRIIQNHPGKDGHTRVVTVRTQTSTFKRPVVKLCPLPIESDSL